MRHANPRAAGPLPFLLALMLCAGVLLLGACAGSEDETADGTGSEAPTADTSTVNEDLGLRLASIPEGLTVRTNEGSDLVLAPTDSARPGEMKVMSVVPELGGVNLVAAVNDHKAEMEEKGGEYRGQTELMGPLGTAYASRGRYTEGGQEMEDFRVFTLHPDGDRMITLHYVYPVPDDTEARRNDLLSVLGEIEPAPGAMGGDGSGEPTS